MTNRRYLALLGRLDHNYQALEDPSDLYSGHMLLHLFSRMSQTDYSIETSYF
ncbi:hypothetical protein YERSI8AC_660004 [Enterobacterales bacterium 8AC]|nr:hypothetical protein YERSI8AC_660004 [Enterobacterales bacterium 8AC]